MLELPALATGGFTWLITRKPETATLSDERIRPAGAAIGASSVQEFEFVAVRAGEGLLVVAYKRPWETKVSEQLEVKIVAER